MNGEQIGMSCDILSYYSGFHLVRLKKTTKYSTHAGWLLAENRILYTSRLHVYSIGSTPRSDNSVLFYFDGHFFGF
jgi:hypothetical protein